MERDDDLEPDAEQLVLPIEDSIDLHAFQPRDVGGVVRSYLEVAVEAGFAEVRLIHGRGIGVQREIVRSVLEGHPEVIEYGDAGPARGGWGATLVKLRRAN